MSFNGSGTFNINSTGQPVVSGTVISSTVFNALTADLATGLSTCITKDGQTTVTANIPMNSFKFTGLAAGTAATDSVRVGQLQAGGATLVTVTGTDTYTGSMSPALAAYAAGNTFTFVVPNTNTTSCTLNIDGLGAKAITRDGSTALIAGDLVAGAEVAVVYDGTRFQVLNSNSKTNFNLSGNFTVAGSVTASGGTANGVAYLNGSKVLTTGSALTFDGTNLGIGTSSPASKLDVAGSSGVTINLANTSDSNRGGKLVVTGSAASGTFAINTTSSGYGITFGIDSTEKMRLDTSGNLGLGTTSTSGLRLAVDSGSAAIMANFNSTNASGGYIRFQNSSSSVGDIGTGANLVSGGVATDFGINTRGANSLIFGTNSVERGRFDGSGNLLVGITSSLRSSKLRLRSSGSTSATDAVQFENSAGTQLGVWRDDGFVALPTTYNNTSASAANVVIDASGYLYRSTSSLKYKTDVQNATHGLAEVLALRPVTYKSKSETDGDKVFGGLIAEEVHAAGLTEFVAYNADNEPDALHYGNMVSLCIKALQEQQALIESLTARIAVLENK